jgi:N6-adenosine-specific RNA methylase IME4
VHTLIERMYPRAARIELFARIARAHWCVWGNEVVVEQGSAAASLEANSPWTK